MTNVTRSSPSRRRAEPEVPPQPGPLSLDRQVCFALYSTSLAMTKLYKPVLGELELTYPQYLVMLALWEHDELSLTELGLLLFLDSGTLTPLVKRLETQALVDRRRDPNDERRVIVSLTPAGRQLRRRAQSVPAAVANATGVSVDELVTLTNTLHRLRAVIGDATLRADV
jgi:DNA-binding MarR family transcriptional regulator